MDPYPGGCIADILAFLLIVVVLAAAASLGLLLFLGALAVALIAGTAHVGGRIGGERGAIIAGWVAFLALLGGLIYGLLQ